MTYTFQVKVHPVKGPVIPALRLAAKALRVVAPKADGSLQHLLLFCQERNKLWKRLSLIIPWRSKCFSSLFFLTRGKFSYPPLRAKTSLCELSPKDLFMCTHRDINKKAFLHKALRIPGYFAFLCFNTTVALPKTFRESQNGLCWKGF